MTDISRYSPSTPALPSLGFLAQRQVNTAARAAEVAMSTAGISAGVAEFNASLKHQRDMAARRREDEVKRHTTIAQGQRALEAGNVLIHVHDSFAAMTQGDPGRAAILAPLANRLGRIVANNIE